MNWTDASSTVNTQGFRLAGTPSIVEFNGTFVLVARTSTQPSQISSCWSNDGRQFFSFNAIGGKFDVTGQPKMITLSPDHLVVFVTSGATLYQSPYNAASKSFGQVQAFFTDESNQQIDNIAATVFDGSTGDTNKLLVVTWTVVDTGVAWIGMVPFSTLISANYNLTAVAFNPTYPLPMPQVIDSLAVFVSQPTPSSNVERLYIIGQSLSSPAQHIVAFSVNPLNSTQWNVTGPSSVGSFAATVHGLTGSSSPMTGCNSSWAMLVHSTDDSLQYSMMDLRNILVAPPVPFVNSSGALVSATRPAVIVSFNQSTCVYSIDESRGNVRLFINENTQLNTHDCINATNPIPDSNSAKGITNNHLLSAAVSAAAILLVLSVM